MNGTKPGLPDYTGPNEGYALCVHHATPVEWCYSFTERLAAIDQKPAHEVATRRAALTLLPDEALPVAWRQADQARRQAEQAWQQAERQAWRQAYQAWQPSERQAWRQAEQAWQQAEQAWQQAEQAWAMADRVALLRRLAPDIPWGPHGLIFPETTTEESR